MLRPTLRRRLAGVYSGYLAVSFSGHTRGSLRVMAGARLVRLESCIEIRSLVDIIGGGVAPVARARGRHPQRKHPQRNHPTSRSVARGMVGENGHMTTSDHDRRRRIRRTPRRRASDGRVEGKSEGRGGGRRRGHTGRASEPNPQPSTLVPQSRQGEAKPALAVEPGAMAIESSAMAPPALDEALTATIRRWAKPTTPEELSARGVKRVRSMSMARMAGLIEKAVNKTLIARTLEGGAEEALTLSSRAREEFLRLARNDMNAGSQAAAAAEGRATSTLDRLRRELAERRRDLADREQQLADDPVDGSDRDEDMQLEEKLRALFAMHGGTGDQTLEHETMGMVLGEVRGARHRAREARRKEHTTELGQLERRISKLSLLLGETEDELRRARTGHTVDLGLESIYDAVQGLDGGDQQFGQKSDLMKCIFEANLALRN